MDKWTPRSWRRRLTSPARTRSAIIELSVISNTSRSAGTPVRSRARRTVSSKGLSNGHRAEMFTDTTSGTGAGPRTRRTRLDEPPPHPRGTGIIDRRLLLGSVSATALRLHIRGTTTGTAPARGVGHPFLGCRHVPSRGPP